MRYPIAIEPGDDTTAYGVVVPDIQGCFSAGDTLDEAIDNAKEAVAMSLEAIIDSNQPVPVASSVEQLHAMPEFEGWIWAMVAVDLARLHDATRRINITMPERVLAMVDAAARQQGESRSAFLANAAVSRVEARLHN